MKYATTTRHNRRRVYQAHPMRYVAIFSLSMMLLIGGGLLNKLQNPTFIDPVMAETTEVPPTPTPTPILTPRTLSDSSIDLIKKTWRNDWKVGVAIASCESGLRPTATNQNSNNTEDVGLFQVNSVHGFSESDMENPVANSLFAYVLYQEQGTSPWNSSKSCWEGRL